MSDKPPMVSILMAVYNDEDYVAESVQSLLDQTLTDFEFLLTEDGSSDSTLEILQGFAAKDSRINLIVNKENRGIPASQNHMIEMARGKYIARFDGDDIAYPHRLERSVAYLEAHPEADAVCAGVQLMTHDGKDICRKWEPATGEKIMAVMQHSNYLTQSTLVAKTSMFKENSYDPVIRDGTEDWDLWRKLFPAKCRLDYIDEMLIRYRLNPNSVRKMWITGLDEAYFYANVCFNQKRKRDSLKYWKDLKLAKSRVKFIVKLILPTGLHRFFK